MRHVPDVLCCHFGGIERLLLLILGTLDARLLDARRWMRAHALLSTVVLDVLLFLLCALVSSRVPRFHSRAGMLSVQYKPVASRTSPSLESFIPLLRNSLSFYHRNLVWESRKSSY